MSLLDMDEKLLELADEIDLVYGPLVDFKSFPVDVDVTLVEGAVTTDHDVKLIEKIRANTRFLVSLGDCAVTGNILAMREMFPLKDVLSCVYEKNATLRQPAPRAGLPKFLERVHPIHEIVKVDLHVPGCPPSAQTIVKVITELQNGRTPDVAMTARFGS